MIVLAEIIWHPVWKYQSILNPDSVQFARVTLPILFYVCFPVFVLKTLSIVFQHRLKHSWLSKIKGSLQPFIPVSTYHSLIRPYQKVLNFDCSKVFFLTHQECNHLLRHIMENHFSFQYYSFCSREFQLLKLNLLYSQNSHQFDSFFTISWESYWQLSHYSLLTKNIHQHFLGPIQNHHMMIVSRFN